MQRQAVRPSVGVLEPVWLQRPDVWADTVRLSTGKRVTVYRCPLPAEGPVQTSVADGRTVLRFMYAHFVFTWPERSPTVDISHGTLASCSLLWPSQPITGPWSPPILARYGQTWTRNHLARFTTARNGAPAC